MNWLAILILLILASTVYSLNKLDDKREECKAKDGEFSYTFLAELPGYVMVRTTCDVPNGDVETSTFGMQTTLEPTLPEDSDSVEGT